VQDASPPKSLAMSTKSLVSGFHHIALVTDDLRAVTDFYAGVLGFRIIRAMRLPPGWGTGPMNRGNPPFEEIRYYFFELGRDCVLSFFEVPKGSRPPADRNSPAGLQQIAFSCAADQFYELHKRLEASNIRVEKPFEVIPGTFAFTFWDPFGTRLEALCAPDHGSRQRIVDALSQPPEAIFQELATLSNEPDWLDRMKAIPGIPVRGPDQTLDDRAH
jgi:catechol 2,3-dioxygenase-like lactoylglutathione lyase family enzyme